MQPILTQIQVIIQQNFPDKTVPLSNDLRLELLYKILPLCQQIPHPASGRTLERWQISAYVASVDLTLVKWLESHLDALSILHELGFADIYQNNPNKLWAVWASEGQAMPVSFKALETSPTLENGICNGTKTWCSGANIVDFGLMTYRDESNQSQLLIVDMKHNADTFTIDSQAWQAVGMQATDTATITFSQIPAIHLLPQAGKNYLERAGFWHGAGGVGACWYGATVAIAEYLLKAVEQKPHAFKAMYLGQISSQLASLQQYFYYVAKTIDSEPSESHALIIRQLRQQVEVTARFVLEHVGLALGATPFCQNVHFAYLTADLSVFIRQSHGAFDVQAIGELVAQSKNKQETLWQL